MDGAPPFVSSIFDKKYKYEASSIAINPSVSSARAARRLLDKLVAAGKLTRVDGVKGGPNGGTPTCWFPA